MTAPSTRPAESGPGDFVPQGYINAFKKLTELKANGRASVPMLLSTLVAPARDSAGSEAGEAVQRAARAARQALVPAR